MSCGKHHEVNCQEILERVYVFIDNELDSADCQIIQAHLAECGPCLGAVDLERMVKALIARSCTERAPLQLRERVLISIRNAQASLGAAGVPGGLAWGRADSSPAESAQTFNTPPRMPGA